MGALDKFNEWSVRNGVHLNRHIFIIEKHRKIFERYIILVQSYPINSQEFVHELMRLHSMMADLAGEMKEMLESNVQDCDDFIDVLDNLKQEIMKHYENK